MMMQSLSLNNVNSTFFSLSSDDKTNKEKIDNAQKTLDSIWHVCEEVKKQEQKRNVETNNDPNDHIVMTGTDYHGDRRSFQAGVISELVRWKKDEFLVMDVTDGEILSTGTIDNIKDDLTNIREKLAEKNKKHHNAIKEKLNQIITDGINPYMQKIPQLQDFSCTVENGVLAIQHKTMGSVQINMESTDYPNELGLINILTDMNADNEQKIGLLYNLIGNQWNKTFESLENQNVKPYQCLVNFFQLFFTPQQKIALVHDFNLKKDFNPEKKRIVLTGDYIDRGEGSCEILCMISNIQKKISTDKRFTGHEDCFIATSGNHESHFCARPTQSAVNNYENDCYANRLAKKMMKDGKLVSGHIIKSDKKDDDKKFYSFSHTFILKTDCYLIMRQIFELEELVKHFDDKNWLTDANNQNEFVMATKEICGGEINNYGKQILKSLAKKYNQVRKSKKYNEVLNKVNENKNFIAQKLRSYDKPIFQDKKVLESGRRFYNDLHDRDFSDEDFFRLRYLSMDALVYPIAASDDEKLDLISKGLKDGKIDIESASLYNNLAFSDFFCRKTTPKCLKSILAISNEEDEHAVGSSPNCLNWNRFFKGITQDDILQNGTQFVGHDPLKVGQFITFHSNIVETDFKQSAGYQNTLSLIDKTFINISNPEKSCTHKYKVSNINTQKPTVSHFSSYTNLFNNEKLKHNDDIIEYSLPPSTTPLRKKILIVFGILFALAGIALLILAETLALTILGSVLLGIGVVGLFITIFFYDKIEKKIYDSCLKTYDTNFVTLSKDEPNKIQDVIKDSEGKKEEEINTSKKDSNDKGNNNRHLIDNQK